MFSFLLGGKPHDFDVWPNKTQNFALRDNKKATVVSGFYPKNQEAKRFGLLYIWFFTVINTVIAQASVDFVAAA